ncbi:MAG: hypothetical protein RL033_1553 [Pseudomonadota bacterium]|jgi:hypothetical protein
MQQNATYSYPDILSVSERIDWTVEGVLGPADRFDFSRPFLPEALAATRSLEFLTAQQQLTLNQIRGNAYLCIFGLVEEFILPFVLDHARPLLGSNDHQVRALLGFAAEEAKHIHLFRRFRSEFERGFGVRCEVIGPPREIASAVLAHHPLGVAIAILHIEWMTQRHYLEGVRDRAELDPHFSSLLKHHWMEEAQHAKLDTLMVEALAESCSASELERAFEDYLAIGGLIDGGLAKQVELDLDALARATGRRLTPEEYERAYAVQQRSNRWTYLGSGMTHPNVLTTLGKLAPALRERLESIAPAFC